MLFHSKMKIIHEIHMTRIENDVIEWKFITHYWVHIVRTTFLFLKRDKQGQKAKDFIWKKRFFFFIIIMGWHEGSAYTLIFFCKRSLYSYKSSCCKALAKSKSLFQLLFTILFLDKGPTWLLKLWSEHRTVKKQAYSFLPQYLQSPFQDFCNKYLMF